jgi:hypothetical protein
MTLVTIASKPLIAISCKLVASSLKLSNPAE